MSIVNVVIWLTFEAGDVERDMVVLESSIPSVLITGDDWLITAKLLLNIDAECPNDIVEFLLGCERLKDKMLGKIIEVRELLIGVEVVGSIEIPTDVFCKMKDCETILVLNDNELNGTESIVEVTLYNIDDRVGITDVKALLLDIDEADNSSEVTFKPMLLKAELPWVDVTTVPFRATELADSEPFLASVKEIRVEVLLAATVKFNVTNETDCPDM